MEEGTYTLSKNDLAVLATHTQMLKDIMAQVTKTNGRVTKLEEITDTHNLKFAVLDAHQTIATQRTHWWKDKIGTVLIGIAVASVITTLTLILQKAGILDISVAFV